MAISKTSFSNTPQASDDVFSYTEDYLLASAAYNNASNVVTLDVMSNDLGGNARMHSGLTMATVIPAQPTTTF